MSKVALEASRDIALSNVAGHGADALGGRFLSFLYCRSRSSCQLSFLLMRPMRVLDWFCAGSRSRGRAGAVGFATGSYRAMAYRGGW
jgi:hypothetical protein